MVLEKNMSTSIAFMELVEEIANAMYRGKFTICVFIDLKKAFDTVDHIILVDKYLLSVFTIGVFIDLKKTFETVDHIILVDKLEHYGIRDVAKKWLSSYLENRKEYVCFNGTNSDYSTITRGVPQDSIPGPTLFILYINDLCKVSSHLKSILFIDDAIFLLKEETCLRCAERYQ